MATEYEIDDLLVEHFANGNGTIFAGAGISLSSRLPSWDQLILPLRKDLGPDAHPNASVQEVAELYEAKHSRAAMIRHLREQLGDVRSQLTRTHELIVRLPVSRIYTTNYDTLLEQASSKLQIHRNVIYDASQVGFSDSSQLSIIKLHGDLNDADSVVITANDYYSYFTRNPAVADLLKVELQTHTVLFLGYSFRDVSLGMILGKVAAQLGKVHPPWYALQLKPRRVAIDAMKARGVKVIALDLEGGTPAAEAGVQDWLECLHRALGRRGRRLRGPVHTAADQRDAHALPPYKHSRFGRAARQRIEAGLHSAFRVVVVKGEPGVGKTQHVAACVAEHLAPRDAMLIEHRFERVIWIRPEEGESHDAHLKRILYVIATTLQSAAQPVAHADPGRERAEVNRLLQDHKVIVVIEDLAGESEPVRTWLEDPGQFANPRSRIIVTTRNAVVAGFVVEVPPLSADEGAAYAQEAASAMMMRRHIRQLDTATVAAAAQGNPQAILLALGLINGMRDTMPAMLREIAALPSQPRPWIPDVFRKLIQAAVDRLDGNAQQLLRAMLLFPPKQVLPEHVVRAAAELDENDEELAARRAAPAGAAAAGPAPPSRFERALDDAAAFNLIERDGASDTLMMPTIPWEMLKAPLGHTRQPDHYHPLARYLLAFLRQPTVICRREIGEPYWNAVLRDEMRKVDPLWLVLRHVMVQLGSDRHIVDFVLLLCHYMDNRSYNSDRMRFVKAAIRALSKPGNDSEQRYRALLLIDALSWTYIEEDRKAEANDAIDKGLKDLPEQDNGDLRALAAAFRGRMATEEHDFVGAERALAEAFAHAMTMQPDTTGTEPDDVDTLNKPWIWTRLYMIRGDVRLMQHQAATDGRGARSARPPADRPRFAQQALADYEKADWLSERYGGEGNSYQTGPRIGLALLQAGSEGEISRAEKIFGRLAGEMPMSLGYLYGEYGLAMIKAKKKANVEALEHLRDLQRKLLPRLSSTNILLKLIRQSCDKLDADIDAARRQAP